jgi:hypothetical protein
MACVNLPHRRLFLFVLLSALDLALTWILIHSGDGQVYEGNPVANWWLENSGWFGLAAFKLAAVSLVGGLSVIIACHRPRVGGFVLSFGCAVLIVAVLYSSSLAACIKRPTSRLAAEELHRWQEKNRLLDSQKEQIFAYRSLRNELAEELLNQRCNLREAVAVLAASERGQDAHWLVTLRKQYPGLTDEQCLAANLVEYTRWSLQNEPLLAEVSFRLDLEFMTVYGIGWQCVARPELSNRIDFDRSLPVQDLQQAIHAGFAR